MAKYWYSFSIGSHCYPAIGLRDNGRRFFSGPFDWILTRNISIIVDIINHKFIDWLNPDYLSEDPTTWTDANNAPKNRLIVNSKYDILFAHDFFKGKSIEEQLEEVQKKYNRRIYRFYRAIIQPTLFVRYIYQDNIEEINYINKNYTEIENTFKHFNENSHVVYLANEEVRGKITAPIEIIYLNKEDKEHALKFFEPGLPANYLLEQIDSEIRDMEKLRLELEEI